MDKMNFERKVTQRNGYERERWTRSQKNLDKKNFERQLLRERWTR